MEIKLQPEEYSKIIEVEIGKGMYATVICNLEVNSYTPERFIIVKELSNFDESLTKNVLDFCKSVAIGRLWYH